MTNNTLFVGVALVILGLYGYFNGVAESKKKAEEATLKAKEAAPPGETVPAVEPEAVSKTALIPAGVGAALLLCVAAVVFNNNLLKHAMHAAAAIGVIGFVGGFMPVFRGGFDWSKTGVKVGVMMSLACGILVGLAVKSFIDARKAREAGQPAG